MSRVTIKTIANDLGISHMTVSRALADNPNVHKKTREAVQKRARELGYVKSAVAMVMRGAAPKIVGLLLPNIVNEFYARFANDMAVACEEHALQQIIHLTNDDPDTERRALERLQEVQASCVVMVPAPRDPDARSAPITGQTRVIELIRQAPGSDASAALLIDDASALRDAVKHLARSGHARIAYLGADQSLSSGRSRLDAFLQGARDAAIEPDATLVHTGPPSFAEGRTRASDVLIRGDATAILCGGLEISNGALSALIEWQQSNSRKVAFIGYGDPSFYAWVNGGVSTIRLPVGPLVDRAVTLVSGIQHDEAPFSDFAASLVIRST